MHFHQNNATKQGGIKNQANNIQMWHINELLE